MKTSFRDTLAIKIGVGEQRKAELYLELARSTTLTDPSYWLQTLFSAGIATLGLVLNSPAVIIGAMLISPLMGPILAGGLSLASGDVVLALRAALNLTLSCIVAVGFAFLLVAILPFKEITNEIAVRTHPNTLDLAVAFFSGAIGSLAICKEVKGVVTSIPGVAIAVALMPPLGVVGYGAALAFSQSGGDGMQVAVGGGLLFLTNLVAIMFTAMIVFLALHIDIPSVKEKMNEWHNSDSESIGLRLITRLPGVAGMRHIGTLPGRLIMILIVLLALLIPLSRSFNQLKNEYGAQQRANRVRKVVTETWGEEFGKLPTGEPRSFLSRADILADDKGKLTLELRILTRQPLTATEKQQFIRVMETRLDRPKGSLDAQIIEVPTTAAAIRLKAPDKQPQLPPSVEQLKSKLFERIDNGIAGLYLPPPAEFINYQLATKPSDGLDLTFIYLSDRDIEPDARALIQQDVRTRLDYPDATVKLSRLPVSLGRLLFRGRTTTLDVANQAILNSAASYLQQHDKLKVELVWTAGPNPNEQDKATTQERLKAVKDYLAAQARITEARIVLKDEAETANAWSVNLRSIK